MTFFRFRPVLGLCLATTGLGLPTMLMAAVCPTPNDDRAAAPVRVGKPPVEPAARVMYDADALRRAGKRAEADAIYTRMLNTPADRRETSRRAALRLSQSALTRGDFATARDFAARATKGASAEIATQAAQLTRRIGYAETIAARGAAYDAVAARRSAGAGTDELVGAYNTLLSQPCPYPDDYHPRIHLQLADVLAEKGDVAGARNALAEAKQETAALSDVERAARIRERASLSERDIDASLLIRQGDALADADPADAAGAEAQYRQVLAMAPPPSISRLISAHFGLSDVATERGDFATARAELDTAKAMATPEQTARVDTKFAQLAQREIDYKARARIDVAQSDARATPTQSLAILDEIIAQQPAPSPQVIQSAQLTQADILRRERFYVKSRTIAQGVATSPQNERLAERAQNLLARIEADTPRQSLHGSVVAGINYDTNAPALVNSLRNEIDDDGYPNNQRFDDGSALARVTLDYRLRLNENGDQWRTRFTGTQTAQFSLERIDRTILDIETGPYFNIPSARMTVGVVGLFSTERRSGDFVQANYGAGINAERRLSGDMVLGGAYELTHRNDRRAGLDGTFHYGRVYLGDTVGLGQTLRGEVQLQYRNVTDPTLDSFRYGGSLSYSYNWGDRETLGYEFSIEPGYQFIDYRSFAGFRRKDERVTAQADFTVTIRRQWQIGLLYQLNNLDSNVAANERLANHRFGIRAGWLF
ncbi:MAG: hypothetical protein QHC67_04560 [Sphingobium sp.]|uniref:hypothetical protein n=1 Tax=Sphingobium sp. TaxID=1912891 RepID=UPI0029A1ADE2|nr:hypothetical protein [Sphingobium sp.]MDX3909072.1 hypothetical protein [Sphingobium sp.]